MVKLEDLKVATLRMIMKNLHYATFLLLVVGGLNWLTMALFNWELGDQLLGGSDSTAARAVYVLVGLSAVYELIAHKKCCKTCSGGKYTHPEAEEGKKEEA